MSNIKWFIRRNIFDFVSWFPFRALNLLFDCEMMTSLYFQSSLFLEKILKSGSSSQWSSSLNCPMRISDQMAIPKTHSTLLQIIFPYIPGTPVFIFSWSMAMRTSCIVKWSRIFIFFIMKNFSFIFWIRFISLNFKCRRNKCNKLISFIIKVILNSWISILF